MAILDKTGFLERIAAGEKFGLELGCGPRKQSTSAIGIDLLDLPGVDLVGDVYEVLARFPDASVTSLYTSHFLEHVGDVSALLNEIARVLEPNATAKIIVPHFSNPFFHSDPTHRTTFGLYTLSYYCQQDILRRGVPNYGDTVALRIDSVKLGFKSYPPRYVRHALKRLVELFVNATTYIKEFYEENLCWLIPCYEVEFVVRKIQ